MARAGAVTAAAAGRPMRRRSCGGFTLLEILISVTLVGILAAIAIPSYSAYIVRGQRAAAKAALEQVAQYLERNYTVSGCYDFTDPASCTARNGNAFALPASMTYAPNDGPAAYVIALGALPAGALAGQGFSVVATPCGTAGSCAPGGKTTFTDPDCGALTLDNTGTKGAGGILGGANPAACWGR